MNEPEGWACVCADGPCSEFPCKSYEGGDANDEAVGRGPDVTPPAGDDRLREMKCRICGKPSGEVTVCAACDELYNALSLLPEIAAVRLWPVPHQAVQELIDGNEESEARLRALEAAAELMLKRDALKGEKDG